jgi:polyisoprenoid-binding protein YceI
LGGEYQVDKSRKNTVKFISHAPLDDFEGVTDKIDGYIYWEGTDLTKTSQMYFEVDLNSIDTGIGLRNRHMRDNYLETDKYPLTYFKGKIISSEVTGEGIFTVQAEGTIFIHGVEKPLVTSGTIEQDNDVYNIRTKFVVKLSDFNIEIPSIMFYKINENMDLHLDFFIKNTADK